MKPAGAARVHELRLVVTAEDYDEALAFYRDGLGLAERAVFAGHGGRVAMLDAGQATLEIADPLHTAFVDDIEVARRVAGPIRAAFKVDDTRRMTRVLKQRGATVIAEPTSTPWQLLNARLHGPAGLHLTLFAEELESPNSTDAVPAIVSPTRGNPDAGTLRG
jgi:predicted enzyme related to lactoylglutathione lyase